MNIPPRVSMLIPLLALPLTSLPVASRAAPLTLVRDLGGDSTRPYYEALHLQSHITTPAERPSVSSSSAAPAHSAPERHYRESDLLPARSTRLTPGTVTPRAIHAPGLTPMFLIGADAASQVWLLEHGERLRALHAAGFVVNVESMEALESLRRHAAGLTLLPTSGDDLALRLHLDHYPVLITATGIEP